MIEDRIQARLRQPCPHSNLQLLTSNLWFGGDEESRTPDPLLARQVLYQLSYTPAGSPEVPFGPSKQNSVNWNPSNIPRSIYLDPYPGFFPVPLSQADQDRPKFLDV